MNFSSIPCAKKIEFWIIPQDSSKKLEIGDVELIFLRTYKVKQNNDLINIGSGREISIYDLSKLIKDIIEYDGKLVLDESMPDGNPRKLIDSTKINNHRKSLWNT